MLTVTPRFGILTPVQKQQERVSHQPKNPTHLQTHAKLASQLNQVVLPLPCGPGDGRGQLSLQAVGMVVGRAGEGAHHGRQALAGRQVRHRRRQRHQGAVRERRGEQLRGQQQQVLQVQLLQGGGARCHPADGAAGGGGGGGGELGVQSRGVTVVDEAEEGRAHVHAS